MDVGSYPEVGPYTYQDVRSCGAYAPSMLMVFIIVSIVGP